MSPLSLTLCLMFIACLLNATDWIWDVTGMCHTWVDIPSYFQTEVELTGHNKNHAAGSSSTSCKSGVSLIVVLSSSDSCNEEQFNSCKLVSYSIHSYTIRYRVE